MIGELFNSLMIFLLSYLTLIIAITVHEFAHAYAADRLGDPTARIMGRLTLNPLPHIDPIGTLLLPLFLILSGSGFVIGWAKPVQIDTYNFENPRRDTAISSFAGPLANLTTAIIASILLKTMLAVTPLTFTMHNLTAISTLGLFIQFLLLLIQINVVLALFNLVPIHPLDGFSIVEGILPEEYALQWAELRRYGMIFLLFLIFPLFGNVSPIWQLISLPRDILLNLLLPSIPVI